VIDSAAHQRLVEWGGPKLLRQMVRLYLENSGERMDQIATGFEEGNADLVERGSHSLKSSAANVGAMQVNKLAEDIEDRAAEGDLDGARTLHEPLVRAQSEAETLLRDIERELAE
jgi:HPt (histidine-containing phosphotransfer) domain-containing protein